MSYGLDWMGHRPYVQLEHRWAVLTNTEDNAAGRFVQTPSTENVSMVLTAKFQVPGLRCENERSSFWGNWTWGGKLVHSDWLPIPMENQHWVGQVFKLWAIILHFTVQYKILFCHQYETNVKLPLFKLVYLIRNNCPSGRATAVFASWEAARRFIVR